MTAQELDVRRAEREALKERIRRAAECLGVQPVELAMALACNITISAAMNSAAVELLNTEPPA